jgi:hypothetical protein
MKVLVIILASDTDQLYIDLQAVWRKYMHRHETFECYFNKADPALETDAKLVGDTLYVRCPESLDHCAEKMRLAFAAFEHRFHEFDYILRTNLSSFVAFDKYQAFLEGLPRGERYLVSAHRNDLVVTNGTEMVPTSSNVISGCFIMMTPSMAAAYIRHPIHHHIDDINFQDMLARFPEKFSVVLPPRMDILGAAHHNRMADAKEFDIFHFRIKHETDRATADIAAHEKLYSLFYQT